MQIQLGRWRKWQRKVLSVQRQSNTTWYDDIWYERAYDATQMWMWLLLSLLLLVLMIEDGHVWQLSSDRKSVPAHYSEGPLFGLGLGVGVRTAYVRNSGPCRVRKSMHAERKRNFTALNSFLLYFSFVGAHIRDGVINLIDWHAPTPMDQYVALAGR